MSIRITKAMSAQEYEDAIKALFHQCDANGDGELQVNEFKPFMISVATACGKPEDYLETLRQKSQIHWQPFFNLMDTSGDASLQWSEVWGEMCNKHSGMFPHE